MRARSLLQVQMILSFPFQFFHSAVPATSPDATETSKINSKLVDIIPLALDCDNLKSKGIVAVCEILIVGSLVWWQNETSLLYSPCHRLHLFWPTYHLPAFRNQDVAN